MKNPHKSLNSHSRRTRLINAIILGTVFVFVGFMTLQRTMRMTCRAACDKLLRKRV